MKHIFVVKGMSLLALLNLYVPGSKFTTEKKEVCNLIYKAEVKTKMEYFGEGCKFIVQAGTDETLLNSVMISAVQRGHEKCLQLLVEEGVDVNAVGPFGHTALNEAVINNQY